LSARMPAERTFEYSDSAVFFTVPLRVAKHQPLVGLELAHRHERRDLLVLPDRDAVHTGLPLAARLACGISCTLSQYTWPRLVKNIR